MSFRRLLLSIVLPLLAIVFVLGAAAPAQADSEGAYHHCAVKQPGGTVWCWGMNINGQVSSSLPNQTDNPGEPQPHMATGTPVIVPGVSGARSVAVDDGATCALLLSGSVQCWGLGPLGDGGSTHSATPVTVSGLSDATAISMGQGHACALRTGGQVVCWGNNSNGQLGDGSTNNGAAPVAVSGISDATAIGAGGDASCAVVSGGGVRCWGRNDNNNLGDGGSSDALTPVTPPGLTDAASVAVQGNAVCVVQTDGDVFCAGAYYGSGTQLPLSGPVRQMAFGGSSGCLVFTSGRIGCGGSDNSYGQFGDGTLITPNPQTGTPADVAGIDDATSVTIGSYTGCATHANGDVSCWGFGVYGGVGTGHYVLAGAPTPVPGLSGAAQLVAGRSHVCALGSGQLFCWGANGHNQIDNGTSQGYWSPVTPSGHGGALAIDAFGPSTCAVEADHSISCWGGGSLAAGGSAVTDATSVQTQRDTACALRSAGTVSCWGSGSSGQLGNGDTSDSSTPVAVTGIGDATQITSGDAFTCALRTGGTVACWGSGNGGQLGNGDTSNSSTPVAVNGLSDATSISAGTSHACAARASGAVSCWGYNPDGQLGDGTTTSSSLPVSAGTISNATAVAAGPSNSCAVLQGGALSCWGAGRAQGQLGFDTNPIDSAVPVTIPGITDAVAAAITNYSACALRSGGTVMCWGINDEGQLGDGFMPDGHGPQPTPHKVIGFGWDGPGNGSGGGDTPPSTPDPPADADPLTPPTLTPPTVTPPVLLPPAEIEALLAGKRITINAKLKLRKGKRCTGTVTATTAFGTTTYRVSLKLKAQGPVCRAAGTIKLKKAPSLRTKLRITISGKPIKARSLTTKRS